MAVETSNIKILTSKRFQVQPRVGGDGKGPLILQPALLRQAEVSGFHRQAGDRRQRFGSRILVASVDHIGHVGSRAVYVGEVVCALDGYDAAGSVFDRVRACHLSGTRARRESLLSASGVDGSQRARAGAVFNVDGNIQVKFAFRSVAFRSKGILQIPHAQTARKDIGGPKGVRAVAVLQLGISLNGNFACSAGRGNFKIGLIVRLQQGSAKHIDRAGSRTGCYAVQRQSISVRNDRIAGIRAFKVQIYVLELHIRAQQNAGSFYKKPVSIAVNGYTFGNNPRVFYLITFGSDVALQDKRVAVRHIPACKIGDQIGIGRNRMYGSSRRPPHRRERRGNHAERQ